MHSLAPRHPPHLPAHTLARQHSEPTARWFPRRLCRAVCGILGAVAVSTAVEATPAALALDVPLVITQVPLGAKPPAAGWEARSLGATDWMSGSRVCVVTPDGQIRVLSQGFHSARDPNVSFDGRHVLFSGRRSPGEHARVWEIGIDGEGLRAVSPDTLEASSPIYVSTLFTLNSPEPWFTTVFVAANSTLNELGRAASSSLYNIKLDGTELRRLTFNPNLNADPFQTWDGRVLYAAERYPSEPSPSRGRFGLNAIHMEGADMEIYGGELGRRIQRMPCATANGLIVFVENDEPTWDGAGQLGCVEARRPHVTYRPLSADPSISFLHPAPFRDSEVLVARRDTRARGTWAICRFNTDTKITTPVFDDPVYHDVQAVLAQPRARPDGHSTIVNTQGDYGTLYGLNCYTTDKQRAGHIQPGEVKRVRLIEGIAVTSEAGASTTGTRTAAVPRRLIGEAPVEADGSFSLELPPDTPMLLQTLDARGLALGTCGWIWVKPKEHRGCIGCHEDPELVPENEYVLALRRSPTHLQLPVADRKSISFRENIAPILQQHCATAECHGSKKTPLRLRLTPASPPSEEQLREAYDALMVTVGPTRPPGQGLPSPGKYVDPGRARTSWLVWQLTGADTSRPWDHGATAPAPRRKISLMPPDGRGDTLSPEEIQTVIQWIDMGAPFEPVAAPVAVPNKAGETR